MNMVHFRDLGDVYYVVLMNEEMTANRDFILSGGKPLLLREMLIEIGKNPEKKSSSLVVLIGLNILVHGWFICLHLQNGFSRKSTEAL